MNTEFFEALTLLEKEKGIPAGKDQGGNCHCCQTRLRWERKRVGGD